MDKIANFFLATEENNYHPSVLSYKAFLIYGIILLLLRMILGAAPAKSSAVDSTALMGLINQERSQRNLPVLFTNQSLLSAAGGKAQDMIDRDYFAHVDPDGNYIWNRIVAAGYTPYKILGENLALDFSTAEGMIKAWLDSPTHRNNLLHTDFRDQGLSALFGDYQGRYTNLTASLFGALVQSSQTPAPPPATTEKTKQPAPPPAKAPTQEVPAPAPKTNEPVTAAREPASASATEQAGNSRQEPRIEKSPVTSPTIALPKKTLSEILRSGFAWSQIAFTLFGIFILIILLIDSVIIHRHEKLIPRAKSSYHLFSFIMITLISILIWWW